MIVPTVSKERAPFNVATPVPAVRAILPVTEVSEALSTVIAASSAVVAPVTVVFPRASAVIAAEIVAAPALDVISIVPTEAKALPAPSFIPFKSAAAATVVLVDSTIIEPMLSALTKLIVAAPTAEALSAVSYRL